MNATDAVNVQQLNNTVNTSVSNLQTSVNTSIAGLQSSVNSNALNLSNLQTTVNSNGALLGTVNTAVQGLNTTVGTLQTGLGTTTTALNTLSGTVTQNTNNIAANAANLGTLTNTVNSTVSTVTGLGNQVGANTTAIANNAAALATNTANLGTLTTTVNNTAGTVASLGNQVGANTTAIANNAAALATNTANLGTLTTTVNNTAGTVTSLGNQVGANTTAIANNAAALATNTASLGNLTTTVNNTAGTVTSLGNQVLQNTTDIGALTNTVNSTVGTVTSLGNQVGANTTAIANNAAALATNTSNLGTLTTTVNNTAGTVTSLGNQVLQNTTDIGALTSNVAATSSAVSGLTTQVANSALGALSYVNANAPTTPLSGTVTNDLSLIGKNEEDPVSLHNVASGTLAAGSTDAVNGGQVFALGQTLNSLTDLAVSYDNGTHTALTLGGSTATAPVSLGNLAAGALSQSSTAAVNGAQLFATNTLVDANSADIAKNTTDLGNLTTNLGVTTDALTTLGNTVTSQGGQLLTLGAQLNQTSTNLAATAADVAGLTTTVQQNGQALTDLGAQVTAQNNALGANVDLLGTNVDALLQFRQQSLIGAVGPVRYSTADAPTTPNGTTVTNDVTIVGATSDPVHVHNVADGDVSASSTDAVNGGQLYAIASQIGSSNGLAVAYDDAGKQKITLGGTLATSPVAITNLAAGTVAAGSTDAINGDQLFATNQNVTHVGNDLATLAQSAITYDDGTHARVTFNAGGAPTTLSNLADGTVALGSTDAVTGNQLAQTNQAVDGLSNTVIANTNTINTLTSSYLSLDAAVSNGSIGPVQYSSTGSLTTPNGGTKTNDLTLVGAQSSAPVGLHNVADGTLSATSTDAVNGSQLYTIASQIGSSNGLGVAYDDSSKTQVTLGGIGATAAVALTNLKDGNVAAGSTDAVTGNQLFATNTDVATVGTQVNALDQSVTTVSNNLNTLAQAAVTYDDRTHAHVTLGAAGSPVTLSNVADGQVALGSTDAVNGGQLAQTNANVTNTNTQLTQLSNNYTLFAGQVSNGSIGPVQYSSTGSLTQPNGGTKTNDLTLVGAQSSAPVGLHNVADGTLSATSTDAVNGSQLYTIASQIGSSNGLGVAYDDSSKTQVTLGGIGATAAVALTNLKDGNVAAGSTDAVTGNQLFNTNTNVATVGAQVNALDQSVTTVSNNLNTLAQAAVTYDDGTHAHVTLGAAGSPVTLSNVADGQVAAGSTDAVNGGQLAQTNADVTNTNTQLTQLSNNYNLFAGQVSNGSIGPVQYSSAGSLTTPNGGSKTNDLTLVGAQSSAPVGLHNVADGALSATSTDAVNGSQLYTIASQISSSNGLAVAYDDSSKARVTLGGAGATTAVALGNVADGTVAAGSTDAVNGGQLFATNARVDVLNSNVDTLTVNIANGSIGPVQYSDAATPTTPNGGVKSNDLTLVGSDNTKPVALHNVADGTVAGASTDAVNGGQLFATNSRIDALDQLSVSYDDASRSKVSFGTAGAPVALTNIANGTVAQGSSDAVTGDQLFATNSNVTNIANNVSSIGDQVSTLTNTVANNSNDISTLNQNVGGLQTDYAALTQNIQNGAVGPVRYSGPSDLSQPNGGTPTNDLTLVGADTSSPVALHNVAAGVIGAGSTDAINGGQLAGLGTATASALGGFTYNPATNSFTGSFTYGGNRYGSVQAVFNAIGSGTSTGDSSSGDAGSLKYFNTNSTLADSSATGSNSTAIGPTATSTGSESIAMGSNAQAQSDQSVAIGSGATATNGRAVSIGEGNVASGNGAVALGDPSTATGDGAVVAGKDDTATGTGAIAMGNTSSATGDGAVALGNFNNANGLGAVALGGENSATGAGAIAIGSNNVASGDNSLAIGSNVTTSAENTLSVGNNTVANADDAAAFGNDAMATGHRASAVGTDTMATGEEASSFGTDSHAIADFATALGANTEASGVQSTAVGNQAVASGFQASAVGANSSASGFLALAFGQAAIASGAASSAIGTQAVATGMGSTAIGTGAVASTDNSVALGATAETARGGQASYSAFGLSEAQASVGEIAVAASIAYPDLLHGGTTPVGNRQITGVAAGSAGTDAVNVSQLRGVSNTLGIVVATGLGGGSIYNSTTGALTGPTYTLFGTSYSNVNDALQALASYDTANGGTGGGGAGGGITNPNLVTYADDGHGAVNLAGNGTTIHNVAPGSVATGSTDAVNGGQLAQTNAQVAANTSAVSSLSTAVQNGAVGTVQYSNAASPTVANGGTKTNDVTLVGANASAPVGLHNVAAGTVSATSTDAVNGSQLAATNAQVATVQATANSALTMSRNSVQYDDGGSSLTLGGADASAPVAVHNVADGTSATDAVNLGQLANAANAAVAQSNAYTDSKIAAVQFDLQKVQKNANAGTAGAMALAGLPQPTEAGRGMISGGVGSFQGQSAFALGLAKALSDEHTIIKVGATYNTRHQVGFNGGIGYMF